MEYKEILYQLTKSNIRYVTCGGLAVNIFGVPRMTADIDILLDFEISNLSNFKKVIEKFGYKQMLMNLPIEKLADKAERANLIETKNLIVYNYFHTQANKMSIDVLIDVPILFNTLWDMKETVGNGNETFYIVNINHLIELKQYSNRLQDQNDIILLSKIKNG